MYGLLGIKFDLTTGESFFEGDLRPLVSDLMKRGIAEPGEGGAIIIKLDRFDLPPALIRKSDGASLYLTRDIASLKYRIKKYEPEKVLLRHWHQLVPDTEVAKKGIERQLQHLSKTCLEKALALKESLKKEGTSSPIFEDICSVIEKRSQHISRLKLGSV